MNQYILTPTRNKNILELFLTNDNSLVTDVSSKKTKLSDHNLVDIIISSNPLKSAKVVAQKFDDNSFRAQDFSKPNFAKINEDLSKIDWNQVRESGYMLI